MNRKYVSIILAIIMVVNLYTTSTIQVFAHDDLLEVTYDNCVDSKYDDGMFETWYIITEGLSCNHLNNEIDTIKYCFMDRPGGLSWSNVADAEEIQNAYAESMKKWNNVYFYSYDYAGNVIKNKIINIIEGTEEDHNLSIFPSVTVPDNNAETMPKEGYTNNHMHFYYWEMGINVERFTFDFWDNKEYKEYVNTLRARTGAHEIGHILGLSDVDLWCAQNNKEDHHLEILMGYGMPVVDRVVDITYKDIAGAAITRGYHTDDDHKWLYCGLSNNEKHKLICSICNGVKYVNDLDTYTYNIYQACKGNHTLSSLNMVAVASYDTKDYYKCRYCSYIAPFSSTIEQDYTKTNYSLDYHKCVNNVIGLEYTFYEEHTLVNHECLACGEHVFPYTDHYEQHSDTQHIIYCECGEYITQDHNYSYTYITDTHHTANCICGFIKETEEHYHHRYERDGSSTHKVYCECGYYIGAYFHVVPVGDALYKWCIHCGQKIYSKIEITIVPGGMNSITPSIRYITDAGSYVDSDGIIYLVDSDMELYLAGELDVYALAQSAGGLVTE